MLVLTGRETPASTERYNIYFVAPEDGGQVRVMVLLLRDDLEAVNVGLAGAVVSIVSVAEILALEVLPALSMA